jgi:hypothetical protein
MHLKEWLRNKNTVSVQWFDKEILSNAKIVELIGSEGIVFETVDQQQVYVDFRSGLRIECHNPKETQQ